MNPKREPTRRLAVLAAGAGLAVALTAVFGLPCALAEIRDPKGVVVGNRNYGNDRVPEVSYAPRDAAAFLHYAVEVLGYDLENVIHLRDADQATLESLFVNDRSHEGRLWRYLDPGGGVDHGGKGSEGGGRAAGEAQAREEGLQGRGGLQRLRRVSADGGVAGGFMMGSPGWEEESKDREGPGHRVTIPGPFAVGRYEVTVKEYRRFVRETGRDEGPGCQVFQDGKWKRRQDVRGRIPGSARGRPSLWCVCELGGCEGVRGMVVGQDREEVNRPGFTGDSIL